MNKHKICRIGATAIITAVIIVVALCIVFNPFNIVFPTINLTDGDMIVIWVMTAVTAVCIFFCALVIYSGGNYDKITSLILLLGSLALAVFLFRLATDPGTISQSSTLPERTIRLYVLSSDAILIIIVGVGSALYNTISRSICRIVFRERSG